MAISLYLQASNTVSTSSSLSFPRQNSCIAAIEIERRQPMSYGTFASAPRRLQLLASMSTSQGRLTSLRQRRCIRRRLMQCSYAARRINRIHPFSKLFALSKCVSLLHIGIPLHPRRFAHGSLLGPSSAPWHPAQHSETILFTVNYQLRFIKSSVSEDLDSLMSLEMMLALLLS